MSEKAEQLRDSIERCFAVLNTLDAYFREYRGQLPVNEIPGRNHCLLLELLRFRHFKRYYFELDYDWQKLKFLIGVYDRVLPRVRKELAEFKKLLTNLPAQDDE